MKKSKPVLLFLIGSFVILLVSSLLYWSFYQNNPEEVNHLRLEDWSQPVNIANNISTSNYDTLFTAESNNLFTIEDENDQRTIKQTVFNNSGENQEVNEIVRADQLGSPEAVSYLDEDYLIYFAGTSSSNQNLKVKNLNDLENPITLRESIEFPGSLTSAEIDDMLVLAYIERDQELGENVLTTKAFDDINGEEIFNNTYTFENGAFFPKLTTIDNEIFLAWHQRNPDTMFISGQQDRFNRYVLNIGQLDIETEELNKMAELGEASGNNSNIDTAVNNDQLWISWVKFDPETESQFIHTGFLNDDNSFHKHSSIQGFNPSILINEEKNLIKSTPLGGQARAGLFTNRLSDEEITDTQRIFPAFNYSSNSKIINYENNKHLFWTEPASTGSDVYYSNTIEPEGNNIAELLGINAINTFIEIISSLAIYFFYPIAGFTMGMANILTPVLIVMLIIYLLSKKFSGFNNLTNDNPLIAFAGIVTGIIAFNLVLEGNMQYLFFLNQPPSSQIPLIIGVVTLVSLGFIYLLDYDRDHALYIGIGSALLWFYWLYQAALVYDLHTFLI